MNATPCDIMKNRLLFQEKIFTIADFFTGRAKSLGTFSSMEPKTSETLLEFPSHAKAFLPLRLTSG